MESREERRKEKLCEKMSLFCSFSPFVMGKLFLRKVKFYLRNVKKGYSHQGVTVKEKTCACDLQEDPFPIESEPF